jgi:signal transduction histidine kinase
MDQEPDASEEQLLRSVAFQTADKVRLARQRAEAELARAKETMELRTAELERALLNGRTQLEIAEVLAQANSIDEAIHIILETLCRNLSCACAQLWRVDRAVGVIRRSAGWCDGTVRPSDFEELARLDSLDNGVGLPGRVVQSQRAAWIEDVGMDSNFPRSSLVRAIGLRSAFGFPLTVAGEVAGVIELFSTERRGVDESILKLAATIGSHIGQFIEREAAEASQRRALKQLKLLQGVTETALASRTLQELFDNLLTKICEAVVSDIAIVLMLDAKANDLYIAAAKGPSLDSLLHLRVRVGESLAGRVAAERRLIIVRQATKDMSIRPALRAIGVETVLGVPLVARDQLIGVLEVGSFSDREFTTDDTKFIQHVSHQVAIAVENASLYDQAREANRIKDRFLSIASHELKTPLNALLGWAEILRTIDTDEMRARGLEAIERNARIQAELIEELLDASRIREGKLVLRLEPTDLTSLVRSALKTVQPAADRRGVKLDSDLPASASVIRADPARLRQVVWNLLTNSIKFTPAGRAIRTRARVDETCATITVEDEGSGISPEFLPRIFEELQQEEKGTRAGGLGLGLYIAKTIVNLHGGTIEAHSEGAGRGATFVIRLPVAGP